MNGKICTKTISDIQKEQCRFVIPDYQRGYRWTKQQVRDLLDDLYEFDQLNPSLETYYCLQPIVVREMEKDGEPVWEVIDGQQRLTTIFILLSYFHEMMPMVEVRFSIDYMTRPGSRDFLQEISKNALDQSCAENIDYYHMNHAYNDIVQWFEGQEEDKADIVPSISNRLTRQTRVIWYEPVSAMESVDIFTRINVGKIPLTDAELIKALLLRKSNASGNNLQKQLEIAGDWDRIEHALQNEQMWYFLTDGEDEYDTRIEFIFHILADQKNKKEIIDSTFPA